MNGTIHGKQLKAPNYTKVSKIFHQQTPNFNNRKEGIIITHLPTTCHTKLTHEHKIKKTAPSTCTHCNNHPLTITHILHECHTTETQRQKYGINANINLTSQNDIQRVLKYLKNYKLLHTYLMAPLSLMTSLSMRH